MNDDVLNTLLESKSVFICAQHSYCKSCKIVECQCFCSQIFTQCEFVQQLNYDDYVDANGSTITNTGETEPIMETPEPNTNIQKQSQPGDLNCTEKIPNSPEPMEQRKYYSLYANLKRNNNNE